MFVLTILSAIVLFILGAMTANYFNTLTRTRFGWEFFTLGQAAHVGLFTLALYGGYHLYLRALEKAGDPLNGILIIVLAGLWAIWWVYRNVRQTNWLWGIASSALSYVLMAPVAVAVILVGFFAAGMIAERTTPTWQLNK